MIKKILFNLFVIISAILLFSSSSKAQKEAISLLKKYDPIGYIVYQKTKPEFFNAFINDVSYDYGVSLAVHESVHGISGFCVSAKDPKNDFYNYYYYMPDETYLKIKVMQLYYRNKIAGLLKDEYKDSFYKTYLTGQLGKQDICVLLDEVNAYTYGLRNSVKTVKLMPEGMSVGARDSLITFMYYLELYLSYGRLNNKIDYNKIKNDTNYLIIIKTLWENAETELYNSIPYKKLSINDKDILKEVYSEANISELKMLFADTKYNLIYKKDLAKKIPANKYVGGNNTYTEDFTTYNSDGEIVDNVDGENSDDDDEDNNNEENNNEDDDENNNDEDSDDDDDDEGDDDDESDDNNEEEDDDDGESDDESSDDDDDFYND